MFPTQCNNNNNPPASSDYILCKNNITEIALVNMTSRCHILLPRGFTNALIKLKNKIPKNIVVQYL